ncbi:MAG TPA: hypothetical protein VI138_04875 [Candidatus Dormibacteraeota bacterium]
MSGGAAPTADDPPRLRHRLLTFAAVWRRTQTMLFYGAAVLLVGTVVTYVDSHKLDLELLIVGILLLLFGIAFVFGGRLHYVQVRPGGLRLNGLRGFQEIPFAEIRQARCQPLHVLFAAPNRRGLMLRSLHPFEQTPACVLRLEADEARMKRLGRAAGRGCAIEHDLILLVAQAKELERSLQPLIPRRPPAPAARRR